MVSVKRRLVYVADESEVLLNELSGTPPTRQSRMTQLLVPLSPPTSSQKSPNSASPLPRPINTFADAAGVARVDTALLVSYDGFLLTEGNGHLSMPRDAVQAANIRDALKTCREFLKGFLNARRAETASPESSSTGSSSSTYIEDDDSDLYYSSSDTSPTTGTRAAHVSKKRPLRAVPQSPSQMTVVELKELLRKRGLSTAGNKACLVNRIQTLQQVHQSEGVLETASPIVSTKEPPLPSSISDHTTRNSSVSVPSLPSRSPSTQLQSPDSHTGDEKNGGIWGALVHAGSRIFRRGARASSGIHTYALQNSDSTPSSKRRRCSA
ncbi:hypothetical protein JKF63_00004 [Porcisia hertigi]|uniref:SAP domain-containing protein n=1 Tax=Porcisia hertigi TaxID=2761500 RepID=A0A836HP75_9TRYP|nr:hypothetical protein JKF63_00004 [Porcisia hertigi]